MEDIIELGLLLAILKQTFNNIVVHFYASNGYG